MHVLYLENTTGFGGSITGLLELIDHLPAEIETTLLSSYDVRPFVALPRRLAFRSLNRAHQPSDRGSVFGNLWRMARNDIWPWLAAIKAIHRKTPIDLIHGNNGCQINIAGALFGRRAKIPTIAHQKCFEHAGRINRLLLRRRWYTHHVATSPAIARHLQSLGLAADRCTTMYEPIPPPPQSCANQTNGSAPTTIGMFSMLTPWKGQEVFLHALAKLRRNGGPEFRAILAGSSPDGDLEYPATLRRLADELSIADLVEFPGHIRDVYAFLATLDVAVHASVKAEPFGRVVAEAMSCGVAVVVSDAGGPSEYVADNQTGFHFRMGDADALADVLRRLLLAPQMRRQAATRGRQFALAEFNPDRLSAEMAALYWRLCGAA